MKRAIPRQGSAAGGGVRDRFWKLQIGKIRQSLQKHLERPVPCKQGAADLSECASASTVAPYFIARCLLRLLSPRRMEYAA